MRTLGNPQRVIGLMDRITETLDLDLSGLTVLTEAASGPFVCTPLLAARAGADVIAVTRTSAYGTAEEIMTHTRMWAERCGVTDRILVSTEPAVSHAGAADILTNLGFLRPINAEVVAALPDSAVIPLMWEAWEFRPEDLDLAACRRRGIPVVGTRETHPALRIFDYLGAVALKLLMEVDIEVVRSHIALVASDPFGDAIERCLAGMGAEVVRISLSSLEEALKVSDGRTFDALVVAEHRSHQEIIGNSGGIPPDALARIGSPVIHICGTIDTAALSRAGVVKHPAGAVKPGYMTVTTDYCGPRPVIDLHAAGLKVGEILARARKAGLSPQAAEDAAAASGLGSLLSGTAP